MTLEQLRIFVAVAERQHVTRAAAALNLAQSAVSAAVSGLEGVYDTRLFHRIGRGIELSEAGRLFLPEARAVLARAAAAELVLSDLAGLLRGTLHVAASQTIASYWLPRRLVTFRDRFPAVEIDLRIGNTEQVAAAVTAGEAELGFVEGTVENAALETAVVARDRMLLVIAPTLPWATASSLTPADLLEAAWVLREPGSGTRAYLQAALGAAGLVPSALRVAFELPSNEAVRAAVEAGAGATVISASVVAGSLEAGLLRAVPFPLPDREFRLLRHRERFRGRAATALATLVTEVS